MSGLSMRMTPLRLFAIAFIFSVTAVAWMILGATVTSRTGEKDGTLQQEVAQLWGGEHVQYAPTATLVVPVLTEVDEEIRDKDGRYAGTRRVSKMVEQRTPIALDMSDVHVSLDLEHRKKGLLWFPTYAVKVDGQYRVQNGAGDGDLEVVFRFPSSDGIYDGFHFVVGGTEATAVSDFERGAVVRIPTKRGDSFPVRLSYASRGLGTWRYFFGPGVTQVKDFKLTLQANTAAVDFPVGAMSPTTKLLEGDHATLTWAFSSVVTGQQIGLEVPALLNPGPVAARISFFAPVSLLFFFAVMVILGVVRNRSMHPMNYGFLAAGFFAFHLLLAYLVDVMELVPAFAVASVVSVALVLSYLRIVLGQLGADVKLFVQAGAAQVTFLVGFSAAFFHEGKSGLTIAVGAVITLFLMMQLTARVRWSEVFGTGSTTSGAPVGLPSSMGTGVVTPAGPPPR